jgi:hypothetical protein
MHTFVGTAMGIGVFLLRIDGASDKCLASGLRED